jgi:hypothetical protein
MLQRVFTVATKEAISLYGGLLSAKALLGSAVVFWIGNVKKYGPYLKYRRPLERFEDGELPPKSHLFPGQIDFDKMALVHALVVGGVPAYKIVAMGGTKRHAAPDSETSTKAG